MKIAFFTCLTLGFMALGIGLYTKFKGSKKLARQLEIQEIQLELRLVIRNEVN